MINRYKENRKMTNWGRVCIKEKGKKIFEAVSVVALIIVVSMGVQGCKSNTIEENNPIPLMNMHNVIIEDDMKQVYGDQYDLENKDGKVLYCYNYRWNGHDTEIKFEVVDGTVYEALWKLSDLDNQEAAYYEIAETFAKEMDDEPFVASLDETMWLPSEKNIYSCRINRIGDDTIWVMRNRIEGY